jgi:hypothetical protein
MSPLPGRFGHFAISRRLGREWPFDYDAGTGIHASGQLSTFG